MSDFVTIVSLLCAYVLAIQAELSNLGLLARAGTSCSAIFSAGYDSYPRFARAFSPDHINLK